MNSNITTSDEYRRGWQDCLSSVRASLVGWPDSGCDINIATSIDDLIQQGFERGYESAKENYNL